jgi:hypothetical protein
LAQFRLVRIKSSEEVGFECLRAELTDFFQVERLVYEKNLLVVTYGLYRESSLVAMVSLSNDSISINEVHDASKTGWISKNLPAVRIVAFAVHKDYMKGDIGSSLLSFLQPFFILGNKTGCRYIIVDAYNDNTGSYPKGKVKKFYRERGRFTEFRFKKDSTVTPMYCDLSRIQQALVEDQGLVNYWTKKVHDLAQMGSVLIDGLERPET